MLSDPDFKREADCTDYESTIFYSKVLKKLAIEEVDSSKIDNELLENLSVPLVVKGISEKFGIRVLSREKTLCNVAKIIGRLTEIKIIDVNAQEEITSTLGKYADYLKYCTPLHKVMNMISFEISNTRLNDAIQAPQFVRNIDWIGAVWATDVKYPQVQKYCLSGMATSYTDFHIDFGGTSVWYHVVNGKKRFYLIAPTLRNLIQFHKWSKSPNQPFFGDVVGKNQCFYYDLTPGDTLILPAGWIHAVYTIEKCLVFGGNFLHKNAILRQMQANQIDETVLGKKYRLPMFRQMNWYTLCMVLPLAQAKYCPQQEDQPLNMSDYEPEVIKMSETLSSSRLFHQFLFLVRVCEEWVPLLNYFGSSHLVIIAQKYVDKKYDDSHDLREVAGDIVKKWWKVLEHVARLRDTETGNSNNSNGSGDKNYADKATQSQSNLRYLNFIRKQKGKLNLFDKKVVGRALTDFDNQLKDLMIRTRKNAKTVKVSSPPSTTVDIPVMKSKLSRNNRFTPASKSGGVITRSAVNQLKVDLTESDDEESDEREVRNSETEFDKGQDSVQVESYGPSCVATAFSDATTSDDEEEENESGSTSASACESRTKRKLTAEERELNQVVKKRVCCDLIVQTQPILSPCAKFNNIMDDVILSLVDEKYSEGEEDNKKVSSISRRPTVESGGVVTRRDGSSSSSSPVSASLLTDLLKTTVDGDSNDHEPISSDRISTSSNVVPTCSQQVSLPEVTVPPVPVSLTGTSTVGVESDCIPRPIGPVEARILMEIREIMTSLKLQATTTNRTITQVWNDGADYEVEKSKSDTEIRK